jgi:hypothetical protein
MRTDWTIPVGVDSQREAGVILHPTATLLSVIEGTATDGVDLSDYATRISQSASDCSVSLTWNTQLNGANQPMPGQVLELTLYGETLWIGVIESINDYRLERGARNLSITARSRDGSPKWRDTQFVTALYPVGTWIGVIATDIAHTLGLTDAEILLPQLNVATVHSNMQMANCTAWQMLENVYKPAGYDPFIDALGRLKVISRNTTRAADIVLPATRVKNIKGSRSMPPVTAIRVKWLDPMLTKVTQQDQPLATESLTAGFFQAEVKAKVKFSGDEKQRAANTYMVIKQSVNTGLLPVARETYSQISETEGRIVLENTYYSAVFVTAALLGAAAAGADPDIAPTGGGFTIPIGRIGQAALLFAAMYVMSSIGSGQYEIRGVPYDWVRARNVTEAYNDAADPWVQKIVEIENDFVMSQPMSEAFASRELLYQSRQATSYGVTIVDDPRIEHGDILELPDGSRLYVTGYQRDLTRGAPAMLDISGFKV